MSRWFACSKDGKTITQDYNTCHEPLAMDETSPEILKKLASQSESRRLEDGDADVQREQRPHKELA